jgi:hypothetical protein
MVLPARVGISEKLRVIFKIIELLKTKNRGDWRSSFER